MIKLESTVRHLNVSDVPTLDPIDVFLQDFAPGRGRITLQCYGDAWTAYFGAMGSDFTIQEFVSRAGADYLTSKFLGGNHKRTKAHEKYLARIIEAVKAALADQITNRCSRHGEECSVLCAGRLVQS